PFSFKFCQTVEGTIQNQESNVYQKPRFNSVAVILSGCGVFDGSEVTETISILIQLQKMNVKVHMFAPNQDQHHVINHTNGEVMNEKRNVLEQSKLFGSEVRDIKTLNAEEFQALLIPGGFGVAKNLSNFAEKGEEFTVNEDVSKAIQDFNNQAKPIGAVCISPILIAKVLGEKKPMITLGKRQTEKDNKWPHSGAIDVAEKLGATTIERSPSAFQIDFSNKIITSPCFMYDGFKKFSTANEGIQLVCQIMEQMHYGKKIVLNDIFQKQNEARLERQGQQAQQQGFQGQYQQGYQGQQQGNESNRNYRNQRKQKNEYQEED
ncbi:hypothetical protein IMG5_080810, partial [Ichthyophthirius multifiliis]